MTKPHISKSLRELVRKRAKQRCEYWQSAEWLMGVYCEIDHVFPWSMGGSSTEENLCLACPPCNAYKQAKIEGTDPFSNQRTLLYNPRLQNWKEHFSWSEDGTHIIGISEIGRATVHTLQLNHPMAVSARLIWWQAGYHPPKT
jgi:5-methylcytosine-specific restriction endonuclease McrA